VEKQQELLSRYGKTLLCFTMNIPGPEKDNPLFREGFRLGCRRLRRDSCRLGQLRCIRKKTYTLQAVKPIMYYRCPPWKSSKWHPTLKKETP
ncbi:MAG: citrate lyase holo-[Clostridia bacterium]|nr:citrate lyase holo-[acyl-carrier protein] synthase [Clostridia bacterium]